MKKLVLLVSIIFFFYNLSIAKQFEPAANQKKEVKMNVKNISKKEGRKDFQSPKRVEKMPDQAMKTGKRKALPRD